jgi:hypothetical protein
MATVRLDVRVCVVLEINPDAFVRSSPGTPLISDWVYVGFAVTVLNTTPSPDLSLHCVTLLPVKDIVVASAPSIQRIHPGSVLGSNPKYCCCPKFTPDAIV